MAVGVKERTGRGCARNRQASLPTLFLPILRGSLGKKAQLYPELMSFLELFTTAIQEGKLKIVGVKSGKTGWSHVIEGLSIQVRKLDVALGI